MTSSSGVVETGKEIETDHRKRWTNQNSQGSGFGSLVTAV